MFSRMKMFSRMMMFSRFLLFMALSCCVCGLELNVAQDNYQAQEMESITLGWTFTPKPQTDLKNLSFVCYKFKRGEFSVLFTFYEGVEFPEYQNKAFSGRVHVDKDKIKEGKIRIQLSVLSTKDSGEYTCDVYMLAGEEEEEEEEESASCHLTVTAARTQTLSTSEPGKNQIQTEPQEPDSGGPGRTALYWGLGTPFAVGLFLFYFLIIHPCLEKSLCQRRRVKLRGTFGPDHVEEIIAL